jgi:hypothetical protein
MIGGRHSEGAPDGWTARREMEMSGRLTAFIEARYPGYIWEVKVDLSQKNKGASVSLPVLLPPHTGSVIPGRYLCTENDMKRYSLEAASALLERYKIPRSPMKMAEVPFLEAREKSDVSRKRRKALVPA